MKNLFKNLRNPKVLKTLGAIIIIILIIVGIYYYEIRKGRVFIDNSLISAPIVSINPVNPGTLTEVDVYEGQKIKKGDPIGIIGGSTLYSDSDGLVVMVDNQIGSTLTSSNPLAQVIQPSLMRVAGTIDENKGLEDVRVGQIASFTVDSLSGRTFWGYVDEVSPTAKSTQTAFSISSERPTQQFVVYANFNAEKFPEIKNGMSAKLTIYTDTN